MGDLTQPSEGIARLVSHVCPGKGYGGAEGTKPEVVGHKSVARGLEKLIF